MMSTSYLIMQRELATMDNSQIKLWQPSNANIGDVFIADWCGSCARDNDDDKESCDICMRTMAFSPSDLEYPND